MISNYSRIIKIKKQKDNSIIMISKLKEFNKIILIMKLGQTLKYKKLNRYNNYVYYYI